MAFDIYTTVTDKIISLLESGVVPWQKPWTSSNCLPMNYLSRKAYRGMNAFMLAFSPFNSPYWLTYKQASEKGGTIKKGSKSSMVVFWKFLKTEENGLVKTVPLLRYYNVFNIEQTEGIPYENPKGETHSFSPIDSAGQIVQNMPKAPIVEHKGGRACYSPVLDVVSMPEQTAFRTPEEYYSTLFHELTHSTGHINRLNRKGLTEPISFGSNTYSKEELIAEMGASFLCASAGIFARTCDNSAAYLKSWISRLKGDNKLILQAAGAAQKASDYILNVKFETEEANENN